MKPAFPPPEPGRSPARARVHSPTLPTFSCLLHARQLSSNTNYQIFRTVVFLPWLEETPPWETRGWALELKENLGGGGKPLLWTSTQFPLPREPLLCPGRLRMAASPTAWLQEWPNCSAGSRARGRGNAAHASYTKKSLWKNERNDEK